MCGYLGHASNWEGCPEQRCVLCGKRGHGKGFCPRAEPARRWKERQGKLANERRRIRKMEKKKELEWTSDRQEMSQKSQVIERGRQAFEDQAGETSRETLSPRSLVRRRHRLADENQAAISEEEIIAPVGQMTVRINEEEMRAPVTQMTTGPMVITFDNAQNITSTATGNAPYANVNSPERQPMVRSPGNTQNIASTIKANWPSVNVSCPEQQPMIRPFEHTQNITSTANDNSNVNLPGRQQMGNTRMGTRLQGTGVGADSKMDPQRYSHDSVVRRYAGINEQRMRAPVAQMTLTTGAMISSFENTQNILSTTMENRPYVNMHTPEHQSLDTTRTGIQLQGTRFGPDSTMGGQGYSHDSGVRRFVGRNQQRMRAPVAKMTTGQMVSSCKNTCDIASMTMNNWPYANTNGPAQESLENTSMGTQLQGTGVGADSTMDRQGYNHDSGVRRFVGRNEQRVRAPVAQMNFGQMINSFGNTRNIAPTTEDNWPHPNIENPQRQPWDDSRISTQRQETGADADATMDQQSSSQDSKASLDSESHHGSVSDRSESDHEIESSHESAFDHDMESNHHWDISHYLEASEEAEDRLDDDGQSSMREKGRFRAGMPE